MFNESIFETLESSENGEWNEWNEWSESPESFERAGSRGPRKPLPRPRQGNATAKAPSPGYATKAELEATANRLDARIGVNTTAIQEVNGRVASIGASHNKLESNVRREIAERKAATDALRQATENMKMAIIMTPLLSAPKTVDIVVGAKTYKALSGESDGMGMMMPMLMMNGGFGGAAGTSGGASNDMMMPMMMMMMMSKK
jgi:hypothetical protein